MTADADNFGPFSTFYSPGVSYFPTPVSTTSGVNEQKWDSWATSASFFSFFVSLPFLDHACSRAGQCGSPCPASRRGSERPATTCDQAFFGCCGRPTRAAAGVRVAERPSTEPNGVHRRRGQLRLLPVQRDERPHAQRALRVVRHPPAERRHRPVSHRRRVGQPVVCAGARAGAGHFAEQVRRSGGSGAAARRFRCASHGPRLPSARPATCRLCRAPTSTTFSSTRCQKSTAPKRRGSS